MKMVVKGNCNKIIRVYFKHKINTKNFLSTILNSFIVLSFALNVANIIEICIGTIR